MAQLTIHLDDHVLIRLKQRAWAQGMPFEDSVRLLLERASREECHTLPRVGKPRGYAMPNERTRLEPV